MIRIVRASQATLAQHPALQDRGALVLRVDPEHLVPWAGARAWLAALRERLHDRAIADAIRPHRAILSLALRGIEPSLTVEERARRDEHRGRQLGFLSHNRFIYWPLVDAWAQALSSLTALAPAQTVVIPNAAWLDEGALVVLRQVLRAIPGDQRPDFVLGYDPAARPREGVWATTLRDVEGQLALLEGLAHTVVERERHGPGDLAVGEGSAPPTGRFPLDPLDDDLERRALVSSRDDALVVRALRASFDSFGFTTALRLGLSLLERASTLPADLRAEVHTLVGLSAYNRQVQSDADLELPRLLEEHFSAALALETDPANRSHLCYRLCINASRRQADLEQGLAFGTRAVEEAATVADPAASRFLEAWARNGRAYVLARMKRLPEAIADCERGFQQLERTDRVVGVHIQELPISRIVLIDNLATLSELARDPARAAHWQRLLDASSPEGPIGEVISSYRWTALHRAEHRPALALRAAERGLAAARAGLDPMFEDHYAAQLGDLHYRLGDPRASYEQFAASLVIRRKVGLPRDVLTTEIGAALAAGRAGMFEEAARGLRIALASEIAETPSARAEVLAALGLVGARRGDGKVADESINEAIDLAAESGVRDVLMRVARTAGEACALLGRDEEARAAFEQALALARSSEDQAPAADVLAILMGLHALTSVGAERDAIAVDALSVAPAALDDPDTWWELPRLSDAVAGLAERGALAGDAMLHDAARAVAAAAGQRSDCPRARQLAELVA